MSTNSNTPHRRLSSRRGSQSAPDPYGLNADADTTRASASRITILPVRATPELQPRHRDRSSWGSAHSTSSSASTGRGRLSFAFSSFTPISDGKGGEAPLPSTHVAGPPSPGGHPFAASSTSRDRTSLSCSRRPSLTPQQICDLTVNTISLAPPASPAPEGTTSPTPFHLLSDEQFLPFLERSAEVTALLTSPPTSRVMALLSQTFPSDLRAPYDPSTAPTPYGSDPAKWSFSELSRWLQTVDREEADDREWVSKARQCVLARSELIWSRLKAALGVPPELEEEEEEYDEEEQMAEYDYSDEHDSGAWLEPIYTGEHTKCIVSPLAGNSPENPFFPGRDGAMESIGEGTEDEDAAEKDKERDENVARAIRGLRLSTPMLEIQPRSRPVSPAVSMRVRAVSTTAAPDYAAEARRREALAAAGPGRVRPSEQQERGTGAPLFPLSFATLTMGPSLVANNPAMRSGPRRTFHPGVPITGRRGRWHSGSIGGWDTDGNDYALSLGSGSERSFGGR